MNKLNIIRLFILSNVLVSSLISSIQALSLEPKDISNVDLTSLIQETQEVEADNGFSFIWWIPQEYWKTALSTDSSLSSTQTAELLNLLEPYFMLAVAQGESSSIGAMRFYSLEQVRQNLTFYYEDANGEQKILTPTTTLSPDVELLQNSLKPILEQTVGNFGQNIHFFTFEDRDSQGTRQISPYEKGTIKVRLSSDNQTMDNDFAIDLPLNSLYVPRICPNGKEADISWQYCPWDGTKLEEITTN